MNGIVVEKLTKTYHGPLGLRPVRGLRNVDLTVEPGEVMGIIGPNGAGKTTLMGCMLGLLRPDEGRVAINGLPTDSIEIRAASGYLPERPGFDRSMTGRQHLAHHHALARLPHATRRADVDSLLAQIGLEEAADRKIGAYSIGMLRRLGLAGAILGTPRFLFLDEPTSGVDPEGVLRFRRLVLEAKRRGATVVLNSHNLDQVERVCDRVAFVREGAVESIQTVRAGAESARVLQVQVLPLAGADGDLRAGLTAAGARAGAPLLEWRDPIARFEVSGDAGAAALLAAIVEAKIGIVQATPEENRLERLFAQPARTDGS